jgi:hypothetical protein
MHYRLYALNGTGRIVNGRDITAATDAEAIREGHSAYPQAPFEIWCQARRVFTHDRAAPSQTA